MAGGVAHAPDGMHGQCVKFVGIGIVLPVFFVSFSRQNEQIQQIFRGFAVSTLAALTILAGLIRASEAGTSRSSQDANWPMLL